MWETVVAALTKYESVAIWLEGIALVAIFLLDWREYRKQGADRVEQHKESVAQMDIMQSHANATRDNAIAAKNGAESAKANAEAAELNTKALVNSQRAWVLIKRVGDPPENWLGQIGSGYTVGIVLQFGVFGITPVRITDARFILRPVPAKQGVSPAEPDLPESPDYTEAVTDLIAQKRMVLPPDATIEIRPYVHGLTRIDSEELRNAKVYLCVWGFLTYSDAFGNSRETRTCYVYHFAWGGVLKAPDGTVLNPAGFKVGGSAAYHHTT
jgi:hypothetical protein